MSSPSADGVMAATHQLVQQAMQGQWQEVPKTVEHRRVLLERLTASASARDQQWLGALRQAMAESDAAVARMAAVEAAPSLSLPRGPGEGTYGPAAQESELEAAQVDRLLEMLKAGR